MKECKCTLAQKVVGDGCSICNPQLMIEMLQEQIQELEATIEAQEIIIKDKAQPKTCDSCEYMEEVDENGWGICSNRKSWLSFGDVPSHGTCKDYEPKAQYE